MKKLALTSLFGLVALVGLAAAYPLAQAKGSKEMRRDCPGKVTCPLTGEEVCEDRCPLSAKKSDATRVDCPGQVGCPLSGELVCRDECPLADASKPSITEEALGSNDEAELPPCCRAKK